MSKKILAVVLALVMVFSVMLPMTVATAATGNWGEISYQIIDGEIKITAITDASYNRIALFRADDIAISSCLETTNSYVEDGNNRVWTITAPVELAMPEGEFDAEIKSFVLRGRDAETNTYKAGGISDAFEVHPEYSITMYGYETRGDKVVIDVTTSAYMNKVIVVSAATGEILGYDGTATATDTGEKDWTITFPYDENDTSYIIKARDERTGKYNKKDIIEFDAYYAPEEPYINVSYEEYDADNYIVNVETVWGLYRVKIAYASDAKGNIAYAKDYTSESENGNPVWSFIIPKEAVTTEYAIDIAYDEKAYAKYYYDFEIEVPEVIPTAPEFFAENTANAITNGWYTTTDGLVQIYVGDWVYYGSYGLTLVAAYTAPVDAATIAIYAADADDVFAAKTAEDFAAVLGETVESFEAVTIAGQYPGYIAKTATYRNLVFQANGSKYFINYINADDGIAIDDVADRAFNNIVVCKPAPVPETNANAVVDGWYTTTDGLVQAYVGNWVYYGSYGLTLVAAYTAPVDAATFAIYAADADDVFAAKTADDFAAVLGETVETFEAVTIAGQYPGYIAITATYRNLVFQANGYKYFINYINADDGIAIDNAFYAVVNSIIVYVPVVEECTHENTTTVTVDATCTEAGSITVTCDDCGEVISTEEIAATGHENTTEVTVQDATCTEAGWVNIVCDACGEVVGGYEIPSNGHGETTTNVTTEPTCGNPGNEQVVCNDCGMVIEENEIPATGEHTYAWEITSMPAIDVAGEKTYTCGVCGDTYTEAMAALAAPTSAEANTVDGTWYTTTDGLVQLYVADWMYYGSYGLTLVKSAAVPTSAATIAVYAADADDVFAAKTADDFAAVLQEDVTSFTAVTIAGQYPGYVAYTASYRNLVFQANGYKYFINIIGIEGEQDACEELFQIMMANVIVYTPCTHENVTTVTTVEATCGTDGLATTTCDDCGEIVAEEAIPATGEHTYAWEITSMPAIDVAGEKTFTCGECRDSYTETMAALTAPNADAAANAVENGWYTTTDGLVQLYVADWMYYGSYGLTLVKSAAVPTSAATIAVYAADADDVFAAKTKADFESVLQETINEFYSVTIAGQYPGYVAYSASYRNLVFQANGYKYFINIIGIDGEQDACEELFQIMKANVIVNEPAVCEHANTTVVETVAGTYNTKGYGDEICDDCGETVAVEVETSYVAPAEELWNTVTDDGWYIYADGKAAMYVGSWVYYGSYGLTLVGAADTVPIDAATIAIYTADADDVFAAKTADDFAAVLGEDVVNFTAVTVAGEYPGYVAETASFRNLVFQANGYKYFINYMPVAGDAANVDGEAAFIAAMDSIIVY